MKMKFKKKDSYSISQKNVKILKEGKIKIPKGPKVPIEQFISESVNKTVSLPLDAIIAREAMTSTKETPTVELQMSTMWDVITRPTFTASAVLGGTSHTVVSVVNKKNSCDGFNFDDATIVGNLMRTSLLPAIYKRIMDNWVDINDKKNLSTNVLFIPDILVYLDKYTGEVLRYPYKVNLLLIAEPSKKDIEESPEFKDKDDIQEELVERIVSDVAEASVKCGASNLVIAPYCHKWLVNDIYITAEKWKDMCGFQPVCIAIEQIVFAINKEDLYIIFKNRTTGVESSPSLSL